jgi:hypothetical protein
LYRLKLNDFLVAARSLNAGSRNGLAGWDKGVLELKDEALVALRSLIRHAAECHVMNHHKEAA